MFDDDENINDEMALAYHLLTNKLEANQKLLSFARLVWPFLAVQGVSKPVSTHIILDGMQILSKKGKITNPPRKPLIGHILRNADNRDAVNQLERIITVLKYEDKEAEKLSEGENSEYQEFQIKSLINPEFLDSLKQLIPYLKYKSIKNYGQLDTRLSTEHALDLSEEYRNLIEKLRGNALRWKEERELIGNELEKMLKNINLQVKDVSLRYDNELSKIQNSIDDTQVREKIDAKKDELTQLQMKEKKNLLDNIAVLFKNLNDTLEEILKKNKFFSSEDLLKRKAFEDIIPSVKDQVSFLRTQGNDFVDSLDTIEERIFEINTKAEEIDKKAGKDLEIFREQESGKLSERDQQSANLKQEKAEEIGKLEQEKKTIESLFSEIKEIIKTKEQECLDQAQELIEWSLKDEEIQAIRMPIQWIYMPFYAIFYEDEDMMEENMHILLPGYITKSSENIYEELSSSFLEIGKEVSEKIEDDMALRSNFEFSIENNSYLKDEKFKEQIQRGLTLLKNQNIISDNIVNQINQKLASDL
ncbi:MAG: hypothetical protein BAJALOKI1v1_80029 [Promethearchaeota archaeon]|nr:MAG: hypothetical protein BAJALOKI1v1_80029 [Candidatus Lokiarchaeota archaeon]